MAQLIKALMTLDEWEHIEMWIRYFTVLAKVKKLKDEKASREEDEIKDLFLAVKKILTIDYPR